MFQSLNLVGHALNFKLNVKIVNLFNNFDKDLDEVCLYLRLCTVQDKSIVNNTRKNISFDRIPCCLPMCLQSHNRRPSIPLKEMKGYWAASEELYCQSSEEGASHGWIVVS